MFRRTVSAIIVAILLTSMLTLAFNIKPVKAGGTIYIRADGSVDPPTAQISTIDNVTYTLVGNILTDSYGIHVQRNNIVLDGAGYMVEGTEGCNEKIYLESHVQNASVKNMKICGHGQGIVLFETSSCKLINNVVENSGSGIRIAYGSNNVLTNNIMTNNEINLEVDWDGWLPSGWVNYVDTSNTVDGKPVYYWIGKQNMSVPHDAGYVVLQNCTNITVESLNLAKNYCGVQLAYTVNTVITKNNIIANLQAGILLQYSSNITVSENCITNNGFGTELVDSFSNSITGNNITAYEGGGGLYLSNSNNNSITGNNITANVGMAGIYLQYSSNNTVSGNQITNNPVGVCLAGSSVPWATSSDNRFWHNNFVDNTQQVDFEGSGNNNIWDDGYPSGGNYWTDYTGVDGDGDGIGDTPYIIDANNTDRYPFINPWTPAPPDQRPTCIISLQKGGVPISQVDVGEFFDIYVGGSTDDRGIVQVRFSNDYVRDGKPTGRWTEWYDWHTSSDDWDALTKIRLWAFYSLGYKEVWAEVIDEEGQTATCSADMYVPAPALPVLVSPLIISPAKDAYSVGDSLTAEFTVENIGETPITLDKLTVGGRINGVLQPDGYPDFTYRQTTLQSGIPYHYSGSLTLTQPGNYRFFIAYNIQNPTPDEKKLLDENNWNTCIELGEDLTQTARVKNIIVFEEGVTPEEVSHMGETISKLRHIQPCIPPYLLSVDSWKDSTATLWAGFTSWATQTDLTEKYDELYYAGINYYGLRTTALSDANHALLRGDIEFAKRCVERSRMYDKLACMSFVAASAVFDGNMEAGQVLAQGIREGCEVAVKLGVSILFPSAGIAADGLYLAMNFGFNTFIEGVDPAARDMALDAVFLLIFTNVDFTSIDPNTLMPYVNQASVNRPFTELLANEEFMTQLGLELKVLIRERIEADTEQVLGEYVLSEIVDSIIEHIRSLAASEQGEAKCPVEFRAKDSEGRVTGIVDGRVKQEIPLSFYCNGTVHIFFPSDSYSYELVGTDTGTYGLAITLTKDVNTTVFTATDIPTSDNATHQYIADWNALSVGEEGVTVLADVDGDGVVERIFSSDSELTSEEFIEKTSPIYPTYALAITTSEGGTTFPPLGTYACSANSTVQVTAFPDEGYVLDYWELDSVNASLINSYTVPMQENHTLNAAFRRGIYDTAVTNVSPSKTVVGLGYGLSINVPVANQGDFAETFNVTLYANSTAIETREITLEGGASRTIAFAWNTTGCVKGNYTLSVYAWPVPGETNTSNNNCTGGWVYVSIIGDITGGTPNLLDFVPDGKVDMKDVGTVARFFNQNVPPAPANCDVTGPTVGVPDGKIDMRDIGLVARHFGDHYP